MKKLLKYPFLCLLVLTAVIAMPFTWQEIGLLPEGILPTLKAGQFILVTGELQARKRDYFCIGAVEEIRRQESRPEVRL